MTTPTEPTCALWVDHHQVGVEYDLYATEQEAIQHAVAIDANGVGEVLGIQYADGSTCSAAAWTAYHDELVRYQATMEPEVPRLPLGTTHDPFTGEEVPVYTDAPGWLGSQRMS